MGPPFIRLLSALTLALLPMSGALRAEEVLLRNKDGKSLTVRLLNITGDKLGVVRGSDKKQFTLDLTQLDDSSRAKVDEWVKAGGNLSERFVAEVNTGKSGRNSAHDYDDQRTVNMEPVIMVKNPDVNVPTKSAKVTALILGRPVNERGAYFVLSTETFDLPSLEGGRQKAFPMKKFRHTYDDRGENKYGSRYLGWVVLIHDPTDQRIMHSQSVPPPLAGKFGGKFLYLNSGACYDSDLEVIKNVQPFAN